MAEGQGRTGKEFQQLENDLLTRAGRGDRAAFKSLYERFQRPLFAFLMRMVRDQAMANELLNDVMLDVWRSAANFEGRSSAGTWIFGAAGSSWPFWTAGGLMLVALLIAWDLLGRVAPDALIS